MMDLVVQEKGNDRVVSARDLYEFLEVKSKFADWIKRRLLKYQYAKENVDYSIIFIASQNREAIKGGQNKKDYILKLDLAKHICMMEDTEKGWQARQIFIEVEKKYNEKLQQELEESRDELETISESKGDNTVEATLIEIGRLEAKIGRELSILKRMYAEIGVFSEKKIDWIKQLGFKTDKIKRAVMNGEPYVMQCLDEKE